MSKIEIGSQGEVLASAFLTKNGYKILETNYKCRFGEVDIIARDGDTLVFVEVKTRSNRTFGLPQEAVGYQKIKHIANVANFYRAVKKGLPESDRIDVVSIEVVNGGQVQNIELIKNITG